MNNKPTLCWDCAKLGKCQVCKPCKDFVKYNYEREYKIEQVAKLCGVSERTVYRWLRKNVNDALRKIYEKTRLSLDYVNVSDEYSKHMFVEKEANL